MARALMFLLLLGVAHADTSAPPPPRPSKPVPQSAPPLPVLPAGPREPLDIPKDPKSADIEEAEMRTLLTQWLDAQNRGDFSAYQALYADSFEGIRRSGPRTVHLGRAKWMADRERMFKKPMTVTADAIELGKVSRSTSANYSLRGIIFVQTWASGSYRDVGKKQLMLIREGSSPLRIAREEMLDSRTAPQ
jgi:hypothetical protein